MFSIPYDLMEAIRNYIRTQQQLAEAMASIALSLQKLADKEDQ